MLEYISGTAYIYSDQRCCCAFKSMKSGLRCDVFLRTAVCLLFKLASFPNAALTGSIVRWGLSLFAAPNFGTLFPDSLTCR